MLNRAFKKLYEVRPPVSANKPLSEGIILVEKREPTPKNTELILIEKTKPKPKSQKKVLYEVSTPNDDSMYTVQKRSSPEIIDINIAPGSSQRPQILYEVPRNRFDAPFDVYDII